LQEEIKLHRASLKSGVQNNHTPEVLGQPPEKELDKLVYDIEKNQKLLNCIESCNYKRRQRINTLRKDRAVFDKIFKNIEMKILKEEKQMIKSIKGLRVKEAKMSKAKEDLDQLENVIGGDCRDKLALQIREIYKKYSVEYTHEEDDQKMMQELTPLSHRDFIIPTLRKLNYDMSVDFRKGTSQKV
jgi:hypothetical protein